MKRLSVVVWCLSALLSLGSPGVGASTVETQSRALQRASDAVVGLKAKAIEDARSSATLGAQRQGSGVVISPDGLVLTIGYLILEAEDVEIATDDGRQLPARVVGYDLATGFGLVQSLVPMRLEPVPMGDAARLAAQAPLVVVSGGEAGAVSMARLVSRRPFSGNWEYHIEGALFTAPARRDHSGAGLFNDQGELVGIGSLWVADAMGVPGGPRQQGNMFVPIDLLKPMLQELRTRGVGPASQRAWPGTRSTTPHPPSSSQSPPIAARLPTSSSASHATTAPLRASGRPRSRVVNAVRSWTSVESVSEPKISERRPVA